MGPSTPLPKLEFIENEDEIEPVIADSPPSIKASDFSPKKKLKKSPGAKKFKVSKVTWGQPPTNELESSSVVKVPKKRGRKPKIKTEECEKPKKKRGRKPKSILSGEQSKDGSEKDDS